MAAHPVLVLFAIILVYLCSSSHSLDFRVTPSVVQPLETTNVSLLCTVESRNRYYSNVRIDQVARLRILKNFQDQWQTVAQISDINPGSVQLLEASISGSKGLITTDPTRNTFLRISWEIASADVFGRYRCDVIGFDTNQVVRSQSSELTLGDKLNALQMLKLVTHQKDELQHQIDQLQTKQRQDHTKEQQLQLNMTRMEREITATGQKLEKLVGEQNKSMHELQQRMEERIQVVEEKYNQKLQELYSKVQLTIDSGFLMMWPRGSYGLVMPNSGCPEGGGFTWREGWHKHHTESTDRNRDKVSDVNHLAPPTLSRENANNFITQHFCTKTETNSVGPVWPEGSYCINKKWNCPGSFREGSIRWDQEDFGPSPESYGELPDGSYNNGTTTIQYCCRKDGAADKPIYLPHSQPFYLYRYDGGCQQVYGMNVTEEYLEFDTENVNNKDALYGIHPDGKIKNVRLQLCYYQKTLI